MATTRAGFKLPCSDAWRSSASEPSLVSLRYWWNFPPASVRVADSESSSDSERRGAESSRALAGRGAVERGFREHSGAARQRGAEHGIHGATVMSTADGIPTGEELARLFAASSRRPELVLLSSIAWCFIVAGAAERDRIIELLDIGGLLARRPDDPYVLFVLGKKLVELNRPREAADVLTRMTRVFPTHAPAWERLAVALSQLGEAERAKAAFREAVRLDPTQEMGLNNLALLLMQQGRFADAEPLLRHAISLNEGVAAAWFNLATIERQRGRLDEAVDCRVLRAEGGRVYSLSERLPSYRNGVRVCIHGTIAVVPQCMTTPGSHVSQVRPWSSCR